MKTATVKKKASEIIVIAGMVLLLTYISDAAVGQEIGRASCRERV